MNRLLPFLLLLISSAALAESGAYRVEVIVFRNLNAEAESTIIQELRSFSQFPSTVEPVQTSEQPAELPEVIPEVEVIPEDLPEGPAVDLRDDLPDDLQVLPKRSDYMNDVWRRLRSSQNYRPLVYAAWEQNRTDYYPPMRIHDETIIDTQLRPPTHIMVADLTAEDPLAAYRGTFYQLDGSVQLRRSRFLHLFLDLEYRESEPPAGPVFSVENEIRVEPGPAVDIEHTMTREVFTLKQNRQVRTGQVQYFDTPYFGALVFVSAIKAK